MQRPSPALVGCAWDERRQRALATPVVCTTIGEPLKPHSPIITRWPPCQPGVHTFCRAIRLSGLLRICDKPSTVQPLHTNGIFLSSAVVDRPPRNAAAKRNDRLNIRHVLCSSKLPQLPSSVRDASRGPEMLGRRGRFLEGQRLTARRIYEQRRVYGSAWWWVVVSCL